MTDQETQICDNCNKPFPESKIATHFGYCRRNIKKCQICGQMYDINFQQEHDQQFHKLNPCKHCKKQFKPNQITKHQQNCSFKTKFCQYCDLNVPIKDFPTHLKACQSRTKNCQKCRKPITNKQYLVHIISCPGYVQQPKPKIQTNLYSNYDQYLNLQGKRKQQSNQRKQYLPIYQQPQRQIKKQVKRQSVNTQAYRQPEKKPQPVYGNIQYGYNKNFNDNRHKQIITQNKGSNKDINSRDKFNQLNQLGANNKKQQYKYITKQYIPISSNNVQRNSQKYDFRSDQRGSSKNIPGQKTPKPTVVSINGNNYGQNQARVVYPSSNVNRVEPSNNRNNNPPISNVSNYGNNILKSNIHSSINNQKIVDLNKRDSKQQGNFTRKQIFKNNVPTDLPKKKQIYQPNINAYNQYDNFRPQQQVNIKQDKRQIRQQYRIPPNNYNPHEFEAHGIHDEDQQLQRVIEQSMKLKISPSYKSSSNQATKKSYKIDQIPPQLLMQDDVMNQSFYDKQYALMQEFSKTKKR